MDRESQLKFTHHNVYLSENLAFASLGRAKRAELEVDLMIVVVAFFLLVEGLLFASRTAPTAGW